VSNAVEGPAVAIAVAVALAFPVVIPQGSAFILASVVACSSLPNQKIVISTEAPHSFIVRRAVEKSAFVFAGGASAITISKDPATASKPTAAKLTATP
jgi:hypothetical protein